MRHLDLDWTLFFDALPAYRELSVAAREALIINGTQNQPLMDGLEGRPALAELVEKGMYAVTPAGRHVALQPRYHAFVKALRAMHRNRIDEGSGANALDRYLADNFTREEWSGFNGPGAYWSHAREGLYPKIATVGWIEEFLNAEWRAWDAKYGMNRGSAQMVNEAEAALLKKLVRHLMTLPEAVPFEALYEFHRDRALVARAVRLGIRRALFFPALRRETLEPVLGLWPKITSRLHRGVARAPEAVTPVHLFCAPLLMDAMTAVLTAAIAEPLRVLSGTLRDLFAKSEKQVAARLMETPDWFGEVLKRNEHGLIANAVDVLVDLKMADGSGIRGEDRRLDATPQGRAWLAMPAKARLKVLLDRVRNFERQKRDWYSHWDELLGEVHIMGRPQNLNQQVREAFGRLPEGNSVRLKDFIAYEAGAHNPLTARGAQQPRFVGYPYQKTEEELEQEWARLLMGVVVPKLVLFGALETGVTEKGDTTIRLSDAGRYLLGKADDFTLSGAEVQASIVVQPNFDIVFMAPSPYVEAELSSFTERQGQHVGAVLKITKKSMWAAAAAGLTADQVVDALRTHASVPVPANVEREIRGWMAQCRRVSARAAMLIHCPDAETASRVLAMDRTRLAPVNDTVLELNDPDYRAKLVKRLREIGIFM